MTDLLTAAKAVIDDWDSDGCTSPVYPRFDDTINALRAAVERAENPPANYNEWTARHSGQTVSPYELWTAAQQAERERIRSRAKLAADKVWKAGDWFIGPQHHILEKFVDALLENGDERE